MEDCSVLAAVVEELDDGRRWRRRCWPPGALDCWVLRQSPTVPPKGRRVRVTVRSESARGERLSEALREVRLDSMRGIGEVKWTSGVVVRDCGCGRGWSVVGRCLVGWGAQRSLARWLSAAARFLGTSVCYGVETEAEAEHRASQNWKPKPKNRDFGSVRCSVFGENMPRVTNEMSESNIQVLNST